MNLDLKTRKKQFANEIEVGNGPHEYCMYIQITRPYGVHTYIVAEINANHRLCRTRIDESRTTT